MCLFCINSVFYDSLLILGSFCTEKKVSLKKVPAFSKILHVFHMYSAFQKFCQNSASILHLKNRSGMKLIEEFSKQSPISYIFIFRLKVNDELNVQLTASIHLFNPEIQFLTNKNIKRTFCTVFKMVSEGIKFALFCTSGLHKVQIWCLWVPF